MVISTGVQQLEKREVKEKLRDGWRMVKFGEVTSNVDINERDSLANGLERYVGLDQIDPESLHIKRWGMIEEGTSFTRKFVKGQVLFGKRRAYQRKVAVADFDGICSGDILVFEAKDDLLPELLPFIVQSEGFYEYALSTSAGSLSPRTKWKDLAAYEFALPPKDEQRRIADILWAIDTAIGEWQNVLSKIEVVLESIQEKIFSEGSKSWAHHPLSDLAILITKGESPHWQGFDYQSSGILFITSENVLFGDFDHSPKKYIPVAFHEKLSRSKVTSGDLLINLVGASIGRACIVPQGIKDANINQAIAVVKLDKTRLIPAFALYFILSKTAITKLVGESVNTARANLSLKNIRDIVIPIPDLNQQQEFCKVINQIVKSSEKCKEYIGEFYAFKKQLLEEIIHRI